MRVVLAIVVIGGLRLFPGVLSGCERGPQTAAELGQAWGENDCKMKKLKDESFSRSYSAEEAKEAYEDMEYLARVSASYQMMYYQGPSERGWNQSEVFNNRRMTRSQLCGIMF